MCIIANAATETVVCSMVYEEVFPLSTLTDEIAVKICADDQMFANVKDSGVFPHRSTNPARANYSEWS